ncbi:UNVERIFIED_CONTAM: hypothetical protein FKN15_038228 [Acipenser sinensis]
MAQSGEPVPHICWRCGRPGHIRRCCRTSLAALPPTPQGNEPAPQVQINIAGRTFFHLVWVVEIQEPCILGLDFLQFAGGLLDVQAGTVQFRGGPPVRLQACKPLKRGSGMVAYRAQVPSTARSPASVPRSPRPLPNFPVASLFSLSPPHSPSAAPWKRSRPPPLALTELDTAPLVAPSPVQPPVQSSARAEHPFRMRRLPDRYDDFVLPRGRGTAVSLPLKGL